MRVSAFSHSHHLPPMLSNSHMHLFGWVCLPTPILPSFPQSFLFSIDRLLIIYKVLISYLGWLWTEITRVHYGISYWGWLWTSWDSEITRVHCGTKIPFRLFPVHWFFFFGSSYLYPSLKSPMGLPNSVSFLGYLLSCFCFALWCRRLNLGPYSSNISTLPWSCAFGPQASFRSVLISTSFVIVIFNFMLLNTSFLLDVLFSQVLVKIAFAASGHKDILPRFCLLALILLLLALRPDLQRSPHLHPRIFHALSPLQMQEALRTAKRESTSSQPSTCSCTAVVLQFLHSRPPTPRLYPTSPWPPPVVLGLLLGLFPGQPPYRWVSFPLFSTLGWLPELTCRLIYNRCALKVSTVPGSGTFVNTLAVPAGWGEGKITETSRQMWKHATKSLRKCQFYIIGAERLPVAWFILSWPVLVGDSYSAS